MNIETKNYRKPKMPKKKKKQIAVAVSLVAVCMLAVAFWFVHPHIYVKWETVIEPTCIEAGEEISECFCGEKTTRKIATLGHKEVINPGYAATKTENGLTDGSHCEFCGKVFKEQRVIYAFGPQSLEYKVTSDATCEIIGLGYCIDTDIVIPNDIDGYKVTSIGNKAFYNCSSLTNITIPGGVTSIGNHSFSGCTNLTSITIPKSVTSIGDYSFSDCTNLTSITIPEGVTSIGRDAFSKCKNLTSVTIPEGIMNIGVFAFYDCDSLTDITIPEGVINIGMYAFYGCARLTSVKIPNSVKSIGDYTLSDCMGMTSVNYTGTVEQWQNLSKGNYWNFNTSYYTVYCTDGTIAKDGTVTYN